MEWLYSCSSDTLILLTAILGTMNLTTMPQLDPVPLRALDGKQERFSALVDELFQGRQQSCASVRKEVFVIHQTFWSGSLTYSMLIPLSTTEL